MNVISEKRKLNTQVYDIVKKLKYKNHKLNLAGSASLQSQQFFSDYDFNTLITRSYRPSTVYDEFIKILSNDDMYFIEFKIEYNDGTKIKIHDIKKLRKSMFKDIKFAKIDYVLWLDYHFTEVSIMYIFRKTKYSVDDIKSDYDELVKDGNIYKSLKRLFSIARMNKNKKDAVKLTRFFNSNKLYSINSNLKAIQLMKETHNTPDVNKKIVINLKDLKLDPKSNVENLIKSNDQILNESAKKYLI